MYVWKLGTMFFAQVGGGRKPQSSDHRHEILRKSLLSWAEYSTMLSHVVPIVY